MAQQNPQFEDVRKRILEDAELEESVLKRDLQEINLEIKKTVEELRIEKDIKHRVIYMIGLINKSIIQFKGAVTAAEMDAGIKRKVISGKFHNFIRTARMLSGLAQEEYGAIMSDLRRLTNDQQETDGETSALVNGVRLAEKALEKLSTMLATEEKLE